MASIIDRRVTADIDGDFVLFLIGMRVNRPWKIASWLPVAIAMPRMLAELAKQPDMGLLHERSHFGFPGIMSVQYWRSFAHLEAYSKKADAAHLPAWKAFNKAVGSNGDVGIWHETYLIAPGRHESIYNNMPPFGLGAASGLVDATGARNAAKQRLRVKKAA